MTTDEAINRFEKLASDCEFNLNMHKNHVMNLSVNDIERTQEHLEEHRQLAEWLRELKMYREKLKTGNIRGCRNCKNKYYDSEDFPCNDCDNCEHWELMEVEK